MRFSLIIYFFLIMAALAGSTDIASAAGIGVSPSSLDFTVEEGTHMSRRLVLFNTGSGIAEFSARSSNPEALEVLPGQVAVGEGKSASVTVTASGLRVGKSNEEIIIGIDGSGGNGIKLALGTTVGVGLNVVRGEARAANAIVGAALSLGIVAIGLPACLLLRRHLLMLLKKGASFI